MPNLNNNLCTWSVNILFFEQYSTTAGFFLILPSVSNKPAKKLEMLDKSAERISFGTYLLLESSFSLLNNPCSQLISPLSHHIRSITSGFLLYLLFLLDVLKCFLTIFKISSTIRLS